MNVIDLPEMAEAIVITPVKDSIETTMRTIEAVSKSTGIFDYYIFNDFSKPETKNTLEKNSSVYGYKLINLEDHTNNPSPNYKLILQLSQQTALEKKLPLIIVESDVIVADKTLQELVSTSLMQKNPGLIGAITVNEKGEYNFPYTFEKIKSSELVDTRHSLSFCCTLITVAFMEKFDFSQLSARKDWFDISISRQSKKMGFSNLLAKNLEVLHLPHSSRPWKNLKYKNPLLYYFKKYLNKRDRI